MLTIKAFLENLGVVATSPYAYIAYVCVLGAWTYITKSRLEFRSIEKLTPDQQIVVLTKRDNRFPKMGLSGEQYIRSQKNQLVFWGFVVLTIAAVLLGSIALVRSAKAQGGTASSVSAVGHLTVLLTCPNNPTRVYNGYITIKDQSGREVNYGEVYGSKAEFSLPFGQYAINITNTVGRKDGVFKLAVDQMTLTYDCDDFTRAK